MSLQFKLNTFTKNDGEKERGWVCICVFGYNSQYKRIVYLDYCSYSPARSLSLFLCPFSVYAT